MTPDDEELPQVADASPECGHGGGAGAEVALVVPPPAYEAIDTEDAPDIPGPPAPAADLGPVLQAVAGLGEALGRRLDGLAAQFDREVRAEANREKVVDRLHAELQEYKQGLLLGLLRPVFVDLIDLHDDIGKIVDTPPAEGVVEGASGRLLDLMRGFQQGIEDILYRQGVEPFAVEDDAFDPRLQRAISTVPADDPAQARRVAARLRKGFRAGDKVIRPEHVSVYAAPRPA